MWWTDPTKSLDTETALNVGKVGERVIAFRVFQLKVCRRDYATI